MNPAPSLHSKITFILSDNTNHILRISIKEEGAG